MVLWLWLMLRNAKKTGVACSKSMDRAALEWYVDEAKRPCGLEKVSSRAVPKDWIVQVKIQH